MDNPRAQSERPRKRDKAAWWMSTVARDWRYISGTWGVNEYIDLKAQQVPSNKSGVADGGGLN
jgi:hypothetical protein